MKFNREKLDEILGAGLFDGKSDIEIIETVTRIIYSKKNEKEWHIMADIVNAILGAIEE